MRATGRILEGMPGLEQDRRSRQRDARCGRRLGTGTSKWLSHFPGLLADGHRPLGDHHPDPLVLQPDHEGGTDGEDLPRVRVHRERPVRVVCDSDIDLPPMQLNGPVPIVEGNGQTGVGVELQETAIGQFHFEIPADRGRQRAIGVFRSGIEYSEHCERQPGDQKGGDTQADRERHPDAYCPLGLHR